MLMVKHLCSDIKTRFKFAFVFTNTNTSLQVLYFLMEEKYSL